MTFSHYKMAPPSAKKRQLANTQRKASIAAKTARLERTFASIKDESILFKQLATIQSLRNFYYDSNLF